MTESSWFMLKALFLGIVEGLTEFIPVSSTAHLLLIGSWIDFSSSDDKVFEVVIQFGSILAVMWIFRERLLHLFRGAWQRDPVELAFMRNLIIAFLPAAVIGALAIKYIKMLFHHPIVFVFTLVGGGLIMLWVERKPQYAKFGATAASGVPGSGVAASGVAAASGEGADAVASDAAPETEAGRRATVYALEDITWRQALVVGFAQCLAMVPGTSRSGATIIGGMLAGIQRRTATEFSFFLAMPTMLAATVYDLSRNATALSQSEFSAIAVGFVAAFFSALFLVRAVLHFISRHTYRPFAWYRIGLGLIVLAWLTWS